MTYQLWGVIGLLVLLILDAFLSAAHAALTNARRHLLREQADAGNVNSRRALTIAEDSSRVLSTFQVANLLAHFLIAVLLTELILVPLPQLVNQVMPGSEVASFLITYLVLIPLIALLIYIVVELLPSTLAQRNAETWSAALSVPAQVTVIVFTPLATLISLIRRRIADPAGTEVDTGLVTEEEIMTLVDAGEEEGAIEEDEKKMIYSIFQLDETVAREIMSPRIDIIALDINTPLQEALEAILKSGHSRIPVYEETLDNIKGLLYAKDLVALLDQKERPKDLTSLMRPALFAPETKKVLDLLREAQSAKLHMIIIIDEYGGTAGLVTIEDIVEEIVGDIQDEYDVEEEEEYREISKDEYIFDSRIDLDDVNELLDVELGDSADTLGGFIYSQLGKIPERGEVVKVAALEIQVLDVIGKRIGKILVRRSKESPPTDVQIGNNHASESKH